ncbi:uncharacterized protein KQ657_001003 [Scheffersomyces spartinae]|uniref:C2H2-type domain-containing protein n=1 Tax=Scheffersomyces spartinae TaxID=45513 RepID=A0A9P7V8B7_9ASCO|nr:uncharacterized protein KQ657_001003 [Scheffersomyces spartinae]KAG7193241.1 hypothetical protein KQ657_001003 [Scheffersomyces spartinae]
MSLSNTPVSSITTPTSASILPTQPIPKKSQQIRTDKPRPHICTICTRAFARLEHLKRHERSHTNEKPFQCAACGRCFARRDLVLRHQQKLHTSLPNVLRKNSTPSFSAAPSKNRNDSMDSVTNEDDAAAAEAATTTTTTNTTSGTSGTSVGATLPGTPNSNNSSDNNTNTADHIIILHNNTLATAPLPNDLKLKLHDINEQPDVSRPSFRNVSFTKNGGPVTTSHPSRMNSTSGAANATSRSRGSLSNGKSPQNVIPSPLPTSSNNTPPATEMMSSNYANLHNWGAGGGSGLAHKRNASVSSLSSLDPIASSKKSAIPSHINISKTTKSHNLRHASFSASSGSSYVNIKDALNIEMHDTLAEEAPYMVDFATPQLYPTHYDLADVNNLPALDFNDFPMEWNATATVSEEFKSAAALHPLVTTDNFHNEEEGIHNENSILSQPMTKTSSACYDPNIMSAYLFQNPNHPHHIKGTTPINVELTESPGDPNPKTMPTEPNTIGPGGRHTTPLDLMGTPATTPQLKDIPPPPPSVHASSNHGTSTSIISDRSSTAPSPLKRKSTQSQSPTTTAPSTNNSSIAGNVIKKPKLVNDELTDIDWLTEIINTSYSQNTIPTASHHIGFIDSPPNIDKLSSKLPLHTMSLALNLSQSHVNSSSYSEQQQQQQSTTTATIKMPQIASTRPSQQNFLPGGHLLNNTNLLPVPSGSEASLSPPSQPQQLHNHHQPIEHIGGLGGGPLGAGIGTTTNNLNHQQRRGDDFEDYLEIGSIFRNRQIDLAKQQSSFSLVLLQIPKSELDIFISPLSQPYLMGVSNSPYVTDDFRSRIIKMSNLPNEKNYFPPLEDLNQYIKLYETEFNKYFPFIHMPSLRNLVYRNESIPLVLAMFAIGSLYSYHDSNSILLFNLSKFHIHNFFEKEITLDNLQFKKVPLMVHQCLVLHIFISMFLNQSQMIDLTQRQLKSMIGLIKSTNFDKPLEKFLIPPNPNKDDADFNAIQLNFDYFIMAQSRIRTIHVFEMLLVFRNSLVGDPILFSTQMIKSGNHCSNENFWRCRDSGEWFKEYCRVSGSTIITDIVGLSNGESNILSHLSTYESSKTPLSFFNLLSILIYIHEQIQNKRVRYKAHDYVNWQLGVKPEVDDMLTQWEYIFFNNGGVLKVNSHNNHLLSLHHELKLILPMYWLAKIKLSVDLSGVLLQCIGSEWDAMNKEIDLLIFQIDGIREALPYAIEILQLWNHHLKIINDLKQTSLRTPVFFVSCLFIAQLIILTYVQFLERERMLVLQVGDLVNYGKCERILMAIKNCLNNERTGQDLEILKEIHQLYDNLLEGTDSVSNYTTNSNNKNFNKWVKAFKRVNLGVKSLYLGVNILADAPVWPLSMTYAEGLKKRAKYLTK